MTVASPPLSKTESGAPSSPSTQQIKIVVQSFIFELS
jgi:hypothetical protein